MIDDAEAKALGDRVDSCQDEARTQEPYEKATMLDSICSVYDVEVHVVPDRPAYEGNKSCQFIGKLFLD